MTRDKKRPQQAFHVHTYRCRHAENVPDSAYIEKAINLGCSGIWFSDHAPFPGDPFGNRMRYGELPEYIDTLSRLKEEYRDRITVHIGLECEYLPSFMIYYETLPDKGIEFLLLGQHFREEAPGRYSFSLPDEERKEREAQGMSEAMIQGMGTGLFRFCAHPDRCFRYYGKWDEKATLITDSIITAAQADNIILEQNISSTKTPGYYRPEFWKRVPATIKTIIGTDAHSVSALEDGIPRKYP